MKLSHSSSLHSLQPKLPLKPASRLLTTLPCTAARKARVACSAKRDNHKFTDPQAPTHLELEAAPSLNSLPATQPSTSTKWSPASWLSGWQGGLTLLSLGAVTGGGLLGSGFDIAGPESYLEAILVLAAVVGVHELGHFTAARTQGIHVTKFAIGFGPTLIKYQGGEVEYSLRAFPLGGFVAFPDDDPDSPYELDDPNLLRNRPVLDRVLVTIAGVVANCVFAYGICLTQATTVGIANPVYYPGVKLGNINPDTVASRAGLQRGDIVLKVGKLEVAPSPGAVNAVVDKIKDSPNVPLVFDIMRGTENLKITVTPAEIPDGTGRIGVSLGANAVVEREKASSPGQAFSLATKDFLALFKTITRGLSQFVSNFKETAENVSGPVAILAVGSEVARTDAAGLYQFAALLNINLAVVNILPLPALDGGFLVFQLLEAIRGGKKIDGDLEKGIMASGFLLLSSMGIFLVIRDAINLTMGLR